jgi:methionyl-tRNA synthetase
MGRYLITSALPYINGVKHLGNLIGSLLPADVYARYLRQQGHEVLFISGTDEHGTPAELAAAQENVPVDIYCKNMFETQRSIYEGFRLSFDYFGRSSSQKNHELTKEIFQKLDSQGLITERKVKQIFSVKDDRFLPDRYVIGQCPHCKYELARGDQCDGCGRLLEATDLHSPRSVITPDSPLEIREAKHLYFCLSHLQTRLEEWINSRANNWPLVTSGIAHKWLQEGLHDRCITRDIHWGISVPKEGFEEKVFYVWFDAPNAYISMTQEWAETQSVDWKKWWKNQSDDVKYIQFMAKDNVPFHAVFWPGMLIGTDENWKLVDVIKGFSWLTYDGGKFSTSQQRGIFTDTALDLFPADYWRYYLLTIVPEATDSDFMFSGFAATVNKDLADVLGNFVNRFEALLKRYWNGCIPDCEPDEEYALHKKSTDIVHDFQAHLEALSFRKSMHALRSLWSLGNEYFASTEPWKVIKVNPDRASAIMVAGYCLLRLIAVVSSPIIPTIAERLFTFLGYDSDPAAVTIDEVLQFKKPQNPVKLGASFALIEKIPPEVVQELTEKYS